MLFLKLPKECITNSKYLEFINNLSVNCKMFDKAEFLYFSLDSECQRIFVDECKKYLNITPIPVENSEIEELFKNNNMDIGNVELHECDEMKIINKEIRINEFYDPEDEDKVYIIKSKGKWELCMYYPVHEYNTTDVESIPINVCPFCGIKLN